MADDDTRSLLAEALAQAGNGSGFKIAAKRTKHSNRLAERLEKNTKIVDELIEVIKILARKPGNADQVSKLLDMARDMLENNAKLSEQVGDALQDIPD